MSEGVRLRIEGLVRTYHKGGQAIEVLRGVDLEVEPGEQIAILGPSGSGKSTFLHIVGTLDRPTAGRVELDGVDVFALPQREVDALRNRRVGFVFQFHHLLPEMSALDNVALPLLVSGSTLRRAHRRAEELLDAVGLSHRVRHRPGELSGGEQQRVAIARALVMGPGLLLADEPTGNLDPRTADVVLDLFVDLNRRVGATTLVVTHSRKLAARFPRRLTVVEGRLAEC